MKSDHLKNGRSLLLGMATLALTTSSVFAATSDCKNPVEVMLKGNVQMKFCEIPAGSAAIGSEQGFSDERPVTKRDFKSFQMGQYTVTQQQYKAVLNEEPWKENGQLKVRVKEGDNYAAVYISYVQANEFVRMMNLIDPSAKYRLPTEAEFEYAARAGTTTQYYWGDEINPSYVYWDKNGDDIDALLVEYDRDVTSCPESDFDKKHPGYCANSFGLMHMMSNVHQWTEDAYVSSYANAPTDGNIAVVSDQAPHRVVRGGQGPRMNSTTRLTEVPSYRGGIGFRLVRIPK